MTEISAELRYARNPDLIATDMDGDIVMMSVESGQYFGIGGVGPVVWELLENPVNLAEVVAAICVRFDVDDATCEADMRSFLGKLVDQGLIRVA